MINEYLSSARRWLRNALDYESAANSLGPVYGSPILVLVAKRYEQSAKSYLSARRLKDSRNAFLEAARVCDLCQDEERELKNRFRAQRLTKVLKCRWRGFRETSQNV